MITLYLTSGASHPLYYGIMDDAFFSQLCATKRLGLRFLLQPMTFSICLSAYMTKVPPL